jgi:hypothetical protein
MRFFSKHFSALPALVLLKGTAGGRGEQNRKLGGKAGSEIRGLYNQVKQLDDNCTTNLFKSQCNIFLF